MSNLVGYRVVRACVVSWFLVGTASSQWVQMHPAVQPSARSFSLMVFDLARGRSVLFSGWTVGSTSAETWLYDASGWTRLMTNHQPSPRSATQYAHDLFRDRIVMFGGVDNALVDLAETWEFDGTDWYQVTTAAAPHARRLGGMAFDTAHNRTVLFGGGWASGNTLNVLADTWVWDGVNWTQLTPPHAPRARWGSGLVAEPATGRILLFGGSDNWGDRPATFFDTWSWDGTDWSLIPTAVTPPARMDAGVAVDWGRGAVVMFSGEPTLSNDTWLFSGNNWVPDNRGNAPAGRGASAMAYDVLRARTVLFGGLHISSFMETWEYTSPPLATWRPFGSGCAGVGGVPELGTVAGARPLLGAALPIEVLHAGTGSAVITLFGLSDTDWNGTTLPLLLDGLGMPGCALHVRPDVALVAPTTNGRAALSLALPNDPALVGTALFGQAVVADGTANAAGFVWSNAGAGIAGTF